MKPFFKIVPSLKFTGFLWEIVISPLLLVFVSIFFKMTNQKYKVDFKNKVQFQPPKNAVQCLFLKFFSNPSTKPGEFN